MKRSLTEVLTDKLVGCIVNICSGEYLIVQANSLMFDSSRLINGLGIFPTSSIVSQRRCLRDLFKSCVNLLYGIE